MFVMAKKLKSCLPLGILNGITASVRRVPSMIVVLIAKSPG